MKYRWVVRAIEKPTVVEQLQQDLNNLPPALARALVLRGIETIDEARFYFRPSLRDLHDPFLMQDMDRAADRVVAAIEKGERVLVYGDYDVDGTTSTALMTQFLRDQGLKDTVYFIPDRFKDGYGLSNAGLDHAITAGATLVIALDCGITAIEEAAYAREKGLDLIICDHHIPKAKLPDAVAVLDPKRPDCPYPFKELSGCGLGFKLIQAVLARRGQPAEWAYPFLDLVAISTASDIVPIYDENRILMREGLKQIGIKPRLGLRKLAELANLDLATCNTRQIVFTVGPRINAAGRMGDAGRAVALMLSDNEDEADRLSKRLEQVNNERRAVDQETLQEAQRLAEQYLNARTRNSLVLYQPHWHLGVIGIVASRLVERFYKPTIMLTSVNGWIKGSARSIEGINVYQALQSCQDLLKEFGGHDFAAGVALYEEQLPEFQNRFDAAVTESLTPEMMYPIMEIDAELDLTHIDRRFWAVLKQFAPYGPENKTPIFVGRDLEVVGRPRTVGRGGSHLKFAVQQKGASQRKMEVIGFGMGDGLETIQESWYRGIPLEMAFSIQENVWNGNRTIQLRARDLRLEGK